VIWAVAEGDASIGLDTDPLDASAALDGAQAPSETTLTWWDLGPRVERADALRVVVEVSG
jgi:hypothetical protein